ncbi:sodium ion-translocating decarboxylase subunit beta [Klebsiella quasipneumoniae subsp. similipneumoniae]
MWFISKGHYNPAIGIAGVSCLPTTAKIAQKEVNRRTTSSFCRWQWVAGVKRSDRLGYRHRDLYLHAIPAELMQVNPC